MSQETHPAPSTGLARQPRRFRQVLEETDRRILDLLRRDGRVSYTELARVAGLSVSAVHQRVRRLEQRGVIRGYRAVVDDAALGRPLTAFVALTPIDPATPDTAPTQLQDLPDVEACYSVAGAESYVLKVRVASTGALEQLLAEVRQRCGMATRTTIVLSTSFEDGLAAPGEALDAADSTDPIPAPERYG
jgi:Lrp/AsnC family leucine-responsive transcriptional regulator